MGRAAELELFRGALEAGEPPFAVLWVHGPGGVGKSALLSAFADEAGRAGVGVARVDLRTIEVSPAGFEAALPPGGLGPGRHVLLLDTYEAAGALDDWVRDRFLAALPGEVLVVIAGRAPPGPRWTGDLGWQDLLRAVSLRNLRPEDARALLAVAGTAPEQHDALVEVTHGHPLALSLVVDVLAQRPEAEAAIDLGEAPDVVRALLGRFVEDVPGPRHRRALEACAHARFMTEDLLAAACGEDDAPGLFAWLRTLSFVEESPDGLFPHDLARDVLEADLRWRDLEAYRDLHRAIRRRIVERIRGLPGRDGQRAAADLVFLHRRNPFTRAYWDWDSFGGAYADALRPGDGAVLRAMMGRHETPEAATILDHWLERQPGAFWVFRTAGPDPIGFAAWIALHEASEDDLATDPAARAMWAHAQRTSPPRPGEEVYAGRFFVDAERHQEPSSASFNVITFRSCQLWLSRPRLAWDYLGPWVDPDAVAPLMAYIDYQRVPEADYVVGGVRYGVFAHDWRRAGPDAWLQVMAEREIDAGFEVPAASTAATVLALSQPEFAAAVRAALRDLHRTDALAANPLLRARVVRERDDGAGSAADVLRDLVDEAVGALRADPRDAKLARALERTYLRPAPTQERAAEALGLPFSTYRRHLAGGAERVVDWLWRRELYGEH